MTYSMILNLLCGGLLLSGVLMVLRRELSAVVHVVVVQGALLAAIAMTTGVHERSLELCLVAIGVLLVKGFVIPAMLRRVLRQSGSSINGGALREARPLVNVTASMMVATLLILLAFVVARPIVALIPTPAGRAAPVGIAVMLLGFFSLVSRRRALSQVVGFVLLDNGISATAFLLTGGVPLIVELGVSLDVLLVVLVLQVLTARLHLTHGHTDLDDLRELHG